MVTENSSREKVMMARTHDGGLKGMGNWEQFTLKEVLTNSEFIGKKARIGTYIFEVKGNFFDSTTKQNTDNYRGLDRTGTWERFTLKEVMTNSEFIGKPARIGTYIFEVKGFIDTGKNHANGKL